jgi:hypothetical protein
VVVVAAGGVAPGDEVVVEGLQRLREGARISRVGAPDNGVPATSGDGAEAEAAAPARRQPSG